MLYNYDFVNLILFIPQFRIHVLSYFKFDKSMTLHYVAQLTLKEQDESKSFLGAGF